MASSFWKNFLIAGRDLNNLKSAWKSEDRTQLQQIDSLMKQAKRERDEGLLAKAKAIIDQNKAAREEEEYQYGISQRPIKEKTAAAELKKIETDTTGKKSGLSDTAQGYVDAVRKGEIQNKVVPQSIRDEIFNNQGWDIYEIQASEEFVPQFRRQVIDGRTVIQVQRKRGGPWDDVDMTKQIAGGDSGAPPSDLISAGGFPPPIKVPGEDGKPSAGGDTAPKPTAKLGKGMQWVYKQANETVVDKYGNTTRTKSEGWYQDAIPKPAAKKAPPKNTKTKTYNALIRELRTMQAGKQYNVKNFSPEIKRFLSGYTDALGYFTLTGPQRGKIWRQIYNYGTGKTITEPAASKSKPGSDLTF